MEESSYFPSSRIDSGRTIDVTKDGKTVEMDLKQINTSTLGMIFSLKPGTIWLQNAMNSRIFLPEDNGNFSDLTNDSSVNYYGLTVNGVQSTSQIDVPIATSSGLSTVTAGNHDTLPRFKSLISKRHSNKTKLKIVAAHLSYSSNGKPSFESQDALFVDIDEANANSTSLTQIVQEEFGVNYIIVSSDGLVIKDSPATRG